MNDPIRLTEESEAARLLLGSASDDAPSAQARAGARHAALAAAGLAVGTGALLTSGTSQAAGKLAGALALKWAAALSVPVGAAALAFAVSQVTAVPVASPPPAQPAVTPHVPSLLTPPTPPVSPEPAVSAAPSAPMPPRAERPAASLEQEITELDSARHALSRGDVSVLDRYLARYPRGALREQALWLKLSYLDRTSQRAQARAAAQRFLAAFPHSSHAARARQLAAP